MPNAQTFIRHVVQIEFRFWQKKDSSWVPFSLFTKDPLPSLPFYLIFAFVILAKTTLTSDGQRLRGVLTSCVKQFLLYCMYNLHDGLDNGYT